MPRRSWASWALLVLGGLVSFLVGVVGYLNTAVVNGDHFAALVNEVRQDDQVTTSIGQAVAGLAIDAQPDLVAIEPALVAGVAAVVGSPVLDPVFTPAISSFHDALTTEDGNGAVLALADFGATVTTALDRLAPDVAAVLPDQINVTLAQFGGQTGIAAQIIPVITMVSTLAWVLPILAVLLLGGAVLVAPQRRVAIVRVGWVLVIVGAGLGLLAAGMLVGSALVDTSTLTGAVASASLSVFAGPLGVRALAFLLAGGLTVAAAGALFPQVDVSGHLRQVRALALRRPASPLWGTVRALLIVGLGLLIVLFPTASAAVVVVLVGLAVLVLGMTELDRVAEAQRSADERARPAPDAPPARSIARWLIPAVVGAAGLAVVGLLILPDHLPQPASSTVGDPEACNGHVELCDRPFDQVVFAASHNSMSVADGSWFLAEQPKDMVESLDDGIRALLVDTWYAQPTADGGAITAQKSLAAAEAELTATYGAEVVGSIRRTIDRVRRSEPTGPAAPYFCHTVCEIGATEMAPVMTRLNQWLDAHPREVVVLFLQDTVTPKDTAAVLEEAGLAQRTYVHTAGASWPTLEEMIDADQRVVVLMENQGGGSAYPYLHQGFDLVADTPYTFATADDLTCGPGRGGPDSPLFLINHWLKSFTRLVSNATAVNTYQVLADRVEQCRAERGRLPNLIAVNWYDHGDLFAVVDHYNGVNAQP